jgi:hypothetical protein
MNGRPEVSDREIADAVSAAEDELLELLARLVETPTTQGNARWHWPGVAWKHSFEHIRKARRVIRRLEPTVA